MLLGAVAITGGGQVTLGLTFSEGFVSLLFVREGDDWVVMEETWLAPPPAAAPAVSVPPPVLAALPSGVVHAAVTADVTGSGTAVWVIVHSTPPAGAGAPAEERRAHLTMVAPSGEGWATVFTEPLPAR